MGDRQIDFQLFSPVQIDFRVQMKSFWFFGGRKKYENWLIKLFLFLKSVPRNFLILHFVWTNLKKKKNM